MKRFVKIASSLYPFLIALIVAFLLFGVGFKTRDAVMNFAFLGWFAKLPGNGHLWFLTVLMVCYVIFFILSRWQLFSKWCHWMILGSGALVSLILTEQKGLPGHAFITLFLVTFVFSHSRDIMEWEKRIPLRWMFLQFVLIGGFTHALFLSFEVYSMCRPLAILLNNLCGVSLLAFLLRLHYAKESVVMTFISGISFELYLVHHGFCSGEFSVFQLTDSYAMMLILLIMVSSVCAFILNKMAGQLKQIIKI